MPISAIIINFFNVEKTSRCIQSLAGQGIKTLYLIDNSAAEDQAQKVIALSEQLKTNHLFPKIKVIINTSNIGFGRAINDALHRDLDYGGHDYYLLLNNDAVAPVNMVDNLLTALQRDSHLYMVSPAIVAEDQTNITYFWYNRLLGHITTSPRRHSFPYISGCCLLLKKDIIQKGNLFDEDFFMYGEDVQLCRRLLIQGMGYKCIDDVSVFHEGSGSSKMGSLFYEYHVARGHIILSSKICNHAQKPLCYMGRFFYLSARCLKRALCSKSTVPLIAFLLSWLPPRIIAKSGAIGNG